LSISSKKSKINESSNTIITTDTIEETTVYIEEQAIILNNQIAGAIAEKIEIDVSKITKDITDVNNIVVNQFENQLITD
jgi:cobalamin biosynthesis protein CbiD